MLSLLQTIKTPTSPVFVQIRTATKRAAGSRTSMKDSAGRRLGPKKYDGQQVKTGEIIMRQRGTKIYPGEYVGIGKDHTLFALEPGFVRYYLDPFHPRKKFVGVSLKEDIKLPRPHFDPRVRRFGHILLDNQKAASKEENSLSRKQYLAKDSIMKSYNERLEERLKMLNNFKSFLKDKIDVNNIDLEIAASYLVRLRMLLRNGFLLEDAQFYSKHQLKLEVDLQGKREQWSLEKLSDVKDKINLTCKYLDGNVSFDNKFKLTDFVSIKEKERLKKELHSNLIKDPIITAKKIKDSTINPSYFLSLKEENKLKRKINSILQSEKGT